MNFLTAEEAASHIRNWDLVGVSGFTAAGSPKAVTEALGSRDDIDSIRLIGGASTGPLCDDALVNKLKWRCPYQSSPELRKRINSGQCEFVDSHLSHVAPMLRRGVFGKVDVAIVEACDFDSRYAWLTPGVGITPTLVEVAEKIILEVNDWHWSEIGKLVDIPPTTNARAISCHMDRVGDQTVKIDPGKLIGVVRTRKPDDGRELAPAQPVHQAIAAHVSEFIKKENLARYPIQCGVGATCNSILEGLDIGPFSMWTEVLQDSVVNLLGKGTITGASSCSLTLTNSATNRFYRDFLFYRRKVVLRPSEISNNPAIIRRLGVVSINAAIEVDLTGCVNSSHTCGGAIMNGIGGSGDFARNAQVSIFALPSTAKCGGISSIVPLVSHVDHTEHDVQVVVTEQGLADLRGLSPRERAVKIIDRCAAPEYRSELLSYISKCPKNHVRFNMGKCFTMHERYLADGSMLP